METTYRESLIVHSKITKWCFSIVVLLAAYACVPIALLGQTVKLPVEVIGSEHTTRSIYFYLHDSTKATRLKIRANNLSYDNKGSFRVNDNAWKSFENANIVTTGLDKKYGGIGGGYSTITFTTGASNFKTGINKVTFRFNKTDGISIGYRVVGFNVLDADDKNLLTKEDFTYENPSQWEAPYNDKAKIDAGKKLWYNAMLWDNYTNNRKRIKATCSSCHAQDGRDLKYFNYSNHSIQQRARFHGLTLEEGKEVASYIRSLDAPAPRHARPWNPPYQPGPAVGSRPVIEWAAGAGLGAVLASDEEMLPYLFPEGTDSAALRKVIDPTATLDLTTIPIAIQFPDWKRWLPAVHPMDMWKDDVFANSRANRTYQQVRDSLMAFGVDDLIARGRLRNILVKLNAQTREWLKKDAVKFQNGSSPWRALEGGAIEQIKVGSGETFAVNRQFAKLYLGQWLAVKYWELMQEFRLEGRAPEVFARGEYRSWPYDQQGVHQVSPHIPSDNINNMPGQDPTVGDYLSSAWYQLQMTVNSGHRSATAPGIQPVDWPYQQRHIYELAARTDVEDPLRYVATTIKMYQQRNNGLGPTNKGWTMRQVHPWWLYSWSDGDRTLMEALDKYEPKLRNRVTAALLQEWLLVTKSFSDWQRVEPGDAATPAILWYKLQPTTYEPTGTIPGGKNFFNRGRDHAEALFKVIPLFRSQGIDCSILNELIDWGAEIWPQGDWQSLKQSCADKRSLGQETGLATIYDKLPFSVYPNPSQGMVTVNSFGGMSSPVRLHTTSGQLITIPKPQKITNNQWILNLSELPKGIYLLTIGPMQRTKITLTD